MEKMIAVSELHHHPLNPRKDLGDLTDLTESIKAQGLIQALAVVPATGMNCIPDGEYAVLAGNRRFEACKAAGLEEIPCRVIEGLSSKEQVGMMLQENIQRDNLTLIEEAKGFQMMLDMGASISDVKEATGFSETKVRHRVKLNELDEEILKEAVDNQITLTQLIELEKVDNIVARNNILKSGNVKWGVQRYIEEKERAEKLEKWLSELKEKYLVENLEDDIDYHYERVFSEYENDLGEVPDDLPKERLFYKNTYGWIYLYTYDEDAEEGTEETPVDRQKDILRDMQKKIEILGKQVREDIERYVRELASMSTDDLMNNLNYAETIRTLWGIAKQGTNYIKIGSNSEKVAKLKLGEECEDFDVKTQMRSQDIIPELLHLVFDSFFDESLVVDGLWYSTRERFEEEIIDVENQHELIVDALEAAGFSNGQADIELLRGEHPWIKEYYEAHDEYFDLKERS